MFSCAWPRSSRWCLADDGRRRRLEGRRSTPGIVPSFSGTPARPSSTATFLLSPRLVDEPLGTDGARVGPVGRDDVDVVVVVGAAVGDDRDALRRGLGDGCVGARTTDAGSNRIASTPSAMRFWIAAFCCAASLSLVRTILSSTLSLYSGRFASACSEARPISRQAWPPRGCSKPMTNLPSPSSPACGSRAGADEQPATSASAVSAAIPGPRERGDGWCVFLTLISPLKSVDRCGPLGEPRLVSPSSSLDLSVDGG